MNPADLITPKIVEYCKSLQMIFVIGYTKTGKVTISKKLAKELNRTLLIADDYIETYGHEDAIIYFQRDIEKYYHSNVPFIAEGVLCFRVLRKLINTMGIIPDMIIKTECNNETITHFYNVDGEGHKINRALGFNQGLNKIWEEYKNLVYLSNSKVKVLELNTSI